jgi:hypothetical protein
VRGLLFSLLELYPKTTLRLWGKVGKGVSPFPKSVTPNEVKGLLFSLPPTLPEVNFLPFGVSWEGVFFPLPTMGNSSSQKSLVRMTI